MVQSYFHWADYLVFALSLALSAAVGIFYGCKDRKKASAEEFLMAGRSMPIFPVTLSMFVSWISAIAFLGDPVEVYYNGAVYIFIAVGYVLAVPIVTWGFAPTFYRMKVTSAYEYLEWRYNFTMRIIGSLVNAFTLIIYLGIVLYAPALALSQVSGLKVWTSILTVGIVCTFYTSLGGMKAVLWADTLQTFIMFAGLVAIVIKGSLLLGGPSAIWQSAQQGDRNNLSKWNPNPLIHSTGWTYLVGGFFRVIIPFTSSQAWVQRYCTCRNERQMKIALLLTTPLFVLFITLLWIVGLIMFAYYQDCDPLKRGHILVRDQLVPHFVVDILGHLPGIPGLFLACVFSASLSTLSSGINAMAATILSDIVQPLYRKCGSKPLSDRQSNIIAQGVSVILGGVIIGLAFVILKASNKGIFALVNIVVGVLSAPVVSAFLVGMHFTFINVKHLVVGGLAGSAMSLWIFFGSMYNPPPSQDLPTAGHCQENYNNTYVTPNIYTTLAEEKLPVYITGGPNIYSFSTVLFIGLGPFVSSLVSLLVALAHKAVLKCLGKDSSVSFDQVPPKEMEVIEEEMPKSLNFSSEDLSKQVKGFLWTPPNLSNEYR